VVGFGLCGRPHRTGAKTSSVVNTTCFNWSAKPSTVESGQRNIDVLQRARSNENMSKDMMLCVLQQTFRVKRRPLSLVTISRWSDSLPMLIETVVMAGGSCDARTLSRVSLCEAILT
jgi:hypothetical protein